MDCLKSVVMSPIMSEKLTYIVYVLVAEQLDSWRCKVAYKARLARVAGGMFPPGKF